MTEIVINERGGGKIMPPAAYLNLIKSLLDKLMRKTDWPANSIDFLHRGNMGIFASILFVNENQMASVPVINRVLLRRI